MLDGKTGVAAGALVIGITALGMLAAIGAATAQQVGGASASTGNVPVRSAADLATVCDAGARDPSRLDAMGYCQGFVTGVGQFHSSLTAEGGAQRPMFCVPSPQPTLNAAIAAFVSWTRANPQHAEERAVDGLMRFAAETYPCPTPPAARRR